MPPKVAKLYTAFSHTSFQQNFPLVSYSDTRYLVFLLADSFNTAKIF